MASSIPRPINIGLTILSIIGLILWTAGIFIGLFFISGGSYGISIPVSIAVGGLMGLFIYLMRRYTSLEKRGYRAREAAKYKWLYTALYIFAALASAYFVMHAVAVTTTVKNECRTAALEDLRSLYNVVDKVNAPDGSYPEYVTNQVELYRRGNSHKDASTLRFECDQLRQRLEKTSGFDNLHDVIVTYWQEADATVRDWDLLYLPSTMNTLHDKQTIWMDSIRACAEAGSFDRYKKNHTPYTTSFSPNSDLYNKFRSVNSSDFSGWSIPVVLLLQILILGAWLMMLKGGAERSTGINTGKDDNLIWKTDNTWTPSE